MPEEAVTSTVACNPDPVQRAVAVSRHLDDGFDEVHVGQTGPHQEAFLDFLANEVRALLGC